MTSIFGIAYSAGVLVAISIPIFTSQLEKAREATDAANIRAAYAEVQTAALEDDTANETKDVALKQTESGWQSSIKDIGGIDVSKLAVGKGVTVEVKYTPGTDGAEGTTSITVKA
jgi:type II secretory pathway pseudopilin PulG